MSFNRSFILVLVLTHLTSASFYERAEEIIRGNVQKIEAPEGKGVTTSFFLTNVDHFHPENSSELYYNVSVSLKFYHFTYKIIQANFSQSVLHTMTNFLLKVDQ